MRGVYNSVGCLDLCSYDETGCLSSKAWVVSEGVEISVSSNDKIELMSVRVSGVIDSSAEALYRTDTICYTDNGMETYCGLVCAANPYMEVDRSLQWITEDSDLDFNVESNREWIIVQS